MALSSAFLAAFVTVAALMTGYHANKAMIDRIKASNQWSFYQAKGIQSAVLAKEKTVT